MKIMYVIKNNINNFKTDLPAINSINCNKYQIFYNYVDNNIVKNAIKCIINGSSLHY